MGPRTGRVLLCRVVEEAAEQSPFKHSCIAEQLAALLDAIPPCNPIHEPYASTVLAGAPSGVITAGALASYFHALSHGNKPDTIVATTGSVPVASVTLARVWIAKLVTDATDRAAFAAGYVQPINDAPIAAASAVGINTSPLHRLADQPLPPTGSEPAFLKLYEYKQRREGESKASEQLYAAQVMAQRLEAENASLAGRLALSESDLAAERQAKGRERVERLAAEEKAEAAEAALAAMEVRAEAAEAALAETPAKVAEDFTELGRSLCRAATWFKNDSGQQRKASVSPVLLVVAGLLELLLDSRRPTYNQGSAADAIAKKGWRAAGVRQVNGVFAEAKKAAKDAKAEATAKAMDVQDSNTHHQD